MSSLTQTPPQSPADPFSTPAKCRPPSLLHLLCPRDVLPKRPRAPHLPPIPTSPLTPTAPSVVVAPVLSPNPFPPSPPPKRSLDKKKAALPRGDRQTPYRCTTCRKYYSRRDNLRAHARVHTGEKPFRCEVCQRPFRWVGALRVHEKAHERGGALAVE